MIADIADQLEDHQVRPDFVFFTGDAIQGAHTLPDIRTQFDIAEGFFEDVRQACGVPKSRTFLVPGNHDVNQRVARGADLDEAWLKTPDRAIDKIERELQIGGDKWGRIIARLADYRDCLRAHGYDHLLMDDNGSLAFATLIHIGDIPVCVAGINSAWSCCESDEKGDLRLAWIWQRSRLRELCRDFEDAWVKVCLMHHPVGWMADPEAVNAEALIEEEFHFLLHGHVHTPRIGPLTNGHTCISTGPCYYRSDAEAGYNIVRLDFASARAQVWFRKKLTQRSWGSLHLPQYSDANAGDVIGLTNTTWMSQAAVPGPTAPRTSAATSVGEARAARKTAYLNDVRDAIADAREGEGES